MAGPRLPLAAVPGRRADHHPAKGGRCPVIFPDLRALDTHIKAGALLPVYLLYGEENRQIEAARAGW